VVEHEIIGTAVAAVFSAIKNDGKYRKKNKTKLSVELSKT